MNTTKMNDQVKLYWEAQPCGTGSHVVGESEKLTKEWFEMVEDYRYRIEPFIHSIAQFTRHHGKRVLEVGVGAGTDHLQWARAETELYGVDLTEAAITVTKDRLSTYGLSSNLQSIDAESLPFNNEYFDVVYSWGVIHHSGNPEKIISEIHRVLKPGGQFICMLYNRISLTTLRVWFKHALLKGRPWRTLNDVLFNHVESIGTKAYTKSEVQLLLLNFTQVSITPILTVGDTHRLPKWIVAFLPSSLGWFFGINAIR
jgi:ubiquinone/menaquinone biosynthesis C-methylase UbiE